LENARSLRSLGEKLLAEGHDEESVVNLAIADDDLVLPEVATLFESVCRELGEPLPSLEEAIDTVTAAILVEIAEGQTEPRVGLRRLMHEVYYPHVEEKDEPGGFVGESHGIQNLIGDFWAYDEIRERPTEVSLEGKYGEEAGALLDDRVRSHALEWLGDHERPSR
jgi:hypothetical protein